MHKTGRLVVVESSGTPIFDAEGNFRGYRGVDRDVGDRKRTEEILRISEERFRQLFEQNEEPQFLFRNGTCEIFDVNTAAVQLYGTPARKCCGKGLPCSSRRRRLQGSPRPSAASSPARA